MSGIYSLQSVTVEIREQYQKCLDTLRKKGASASAVDRTLADNVFRKNNELSRVEENWQQSKSDIASDSRRAQALRGKGKRENKTSR